MRRALARFVLSKQKESTLFKKEFARSLGISPTALFDWASILNGARPVRTVTLDNLIRVVGKLGYRVEIRVVKK